MASVAAMDTHTRRIYRIRSRTLCAIRPPRRRTCFEKALRKGRAIPEAERIAWRQMRSRPLSMSLGLKRASERIKHI